MHRLKPITAALVMALVAAIAAPGTGLAAQTDAASPITSYFDHW
jgi:hypothetical protein